MAGKSTVDAGARRGPQPLALAFLALFVLLIAGALGIAFLGDPRAAEPLVSVDLPRGWLGGHVAPRPVRKAAAPVSPDQVSEAPPIKVTQQMFAGRALIADPSLVENTAMGPLPKIADSGTTPMHAYAPPAPSDGRPHIAIVIGGLGVSAKQTEAALAGLPAGVTLAFAPYAADVQHWTSLARAQGHEVLLEVPMEPFDYPDSDPGPHTLRAGGSENANIERLAWALTRITGYAGITNLQGSRFLSDTNSLEPVLTYLARRGLMFFDDGSADHPAASDVALRVGVPFVQANSKIDSIPAATEIDQRLSALETDARSHGSAGGSGQIYPVTIDRVRNWAQGLAGRGFVLVPASAIVAASK